jgi:transcription initiation factor TFIID subunit 3
LQVLKTKQGRSTADIRYQGTALGIPGEDRSVVIEGGPVGSLRDWRPSQTYARPNPIDLPAAKEAREDEPMRDSPNGLAAHEDEPMEDVAAAT